MSAPFLTLVIGGLNVCLGYLLAVRLGYGPPRLAHRLEVPATDPPNGRPGSPMPEALAGSPDGLIQELISSPLDGIFEHPQPADPADDRE
jgi:hypothetical protein